MDYLGYQVINGPVFGLLKTQYFQETNKFGSN